MRPLPFALMLFKLDHSPRYAHRARGVCCISVARPARSTYDAMAIPTTSLRKATGARHAGKADLGRQSHRPDLPSARSVVVGGAAEMEADGAARRGKGRWAALVCRRPGQGHVERYRPRIPAVPERNVRSYRRDEG